MIIAKRDNNPVLNMFYTISDSLFQAFYLFRRQNSKLVLSLIFMAFSGDFLVMALVFCEDIYDFAGEEKKITEFL